MTYVTNATPQQIKADTFARTCDVYVLLNMGVPHVSVYVCPCMNDNNV